jgi:lipoate-protein ligase A
MPYVERGGAESIAADDALLDAVAAGAPATVAWYGYDAPSLILGYGQRGPVADEAACAARGLPVLRRRGGGAAVLAEPGLLGLAVALPKGHPLNVDDVTAAYRWLGEAFVGPLIDLGASARLVDVPEARADAAAARGADRALVCFGSLSPFEVVVGRRKLVGLAQIRRRGATLFQAGIYLGPTVHEIADLLAVPAERRVDLATDLAARTTDLETVTGRRYAPGDLIAAIDLRLG